MDWSVKNAVEAHVLEISGYAEESIGYKALKMLFRCDEVDFRWFNSQALKDVRMHMYLLGFKIGMKWDRLILEEINVIEYYQIKMGLEYISEVEDKTYFQKSMDKKNEKL